MVTFRTMRLIMKWTRSRRMKRQEKEETLFRRRLSSAERCQLFRTKILGLAVWS